MGGELSIGMLARLYGRDFNISLDWTVRLAAVLCLCVYTILTAYFIRTRCISRLYFKMNFLFFHCFEVLRAFTRADIIVMC